MNRELISKALNQTDEELIAQAMTYRGGKRDKPPERNAEMTKQGVFKGKRKMIVGVLAACLVFALASTAYAANFLGIREMWQRPDRQLPEAAADQIDQHSESGAAKAGTPVLRNLFATLRLLW